MKYIFIVNLLFHILYTFGMEKSQLDLAIKELDRMAEQYDFTSDFTFVPLDDEQAKQPSNNKKNRRKKSNLLKLICCHK